MPDGHIQKQSIDCLWLARAMPFPLTAGDRIYSAKLAAALADAGASVRFAGLAAGASPDAVPGVEWHIVPGQQRSQVGSLLSTLPLVAARHATPAYRRHVTRLLHSRPWDAVLIDHYGSGWTAELIERLPYRPVRVFVTHNHEAGVATSQWQDSAQSPPRRAYFYQNWLKTAALEKRVARSSSLITAITGADANQFARDAPGVRTIELTPGYDGKRLERRAITADTPRSIVLFGSFVWSAKRASLTVFLDQADRLMARAGITIDVVGDMDQTLRRSLSAKYRAVRFHGFVEDPTPYLASARMAVLAEPVGGGFKLKLLEYIFNRVPVAALTCCAAGLPAAVRAHMLLVDEMPALLAAVAAMMDRTDRLNALQNGACEAASRMFDWDERGRILLDAIRQIRSAARTVPASL
jgi:glycosyltransferase involved in cell wall biosynthesis